MKMILDTLPSGEVVCYGPFANYDDAHVWGYATLGADALWLVYDVVAP